MRVNVGTTATMTILSKRKKGSQISTCKTRRLSGGNSERGLFQAPGPAQQSGQENILKLGYGRKKRGRSGKRYLQVVLLEISSIRKIFRLPEV